MRRRTVVHRLAPSSPSATPIQHEVCPDCGCCTLEGNPETHYFTWMQGWICQCWMYEDVYEGDDEDDEYVF